MNKYHQEILSEIKIISGNEIPNRLGFGIKYVGTDKNTYHLNTADIRKIAKNFVKNNPYDLKKYTSLLDSLYSKGTFDEVSIAAKIVEFSPQLKSEFDLKSLDYWLSFTVGWCEVDTLCQMAFTDIDILTRWSEWEELLNKFSIDKNVHKRRASIVLLTKPVRLSSDTKLSNLAFKNVDLLKSEKDILITKAVSWILRSLIKNHSTEVATYLEINKDLLPKIAVREVTMKLLTGKKYINGKK